MLRSELHYDLPPELIAQHPVSPRDAARMLVVDRAADTLTHHVFSDLAHFLRAGDILVVNDTRVVPARFFARRATGGKVEALFLRETESGWRCLLKPSARLRLGETLTAPGAPAALRLQRRHPRGEWTVATDPPTVAALDFLRAVGQMPLPPYIARPDGPVAADAEEYQTVYASRPGAVAAPTAGLHFTDRLLGELAAAGVQRATVTLHVGEGTFAPIDADDLAQHDMHAEWYEVADDQRRRIAAARAAGGRVVAVGTTAVRTLESIDLNRAGDQSGWTDIFLYPPHEFRNVDVLITNFHLPGSTLIALVMALAGIERTRRAYAAAVADRYRFFSYGDAMLIL